MAAGLVAYGTTVMGRANIRMYLLAEITEVHPTYLSLPFYVACLFTIGHQQVAVLDSVTISCWRLYRETSSATIRKTHDLHRFT